MKQRVHFLTFVALLVAMIAIVFAGVHKAFERAKFWLMFAFALVLVAADAVLGAVLYVVQMQFGLLEGAFVPGLDNEFWIQLGVAEADEVSLE